MKYIRVIRESYSNTKYKGSLKFPSNQRKENIYKINKKIRLTLKFIDYTPYKRIIL